MTLEWFPDQASAEAAEKVAIREELPLFNIAHAVAGSPDRAAEYLCQHGVVAGIGLAS